MAVDYLKDLDPTRPIDEDSRKQGDDEFRALKRVLLNLFPNFTSSSANPNSVAATEDDLSKIAGVAQAGVDPIGLLNNSVVGFDGLPRAPRNNFISQSGVSGTRIIDGSKYNSIFFQLAQGNLICQIDGAKNGQQFMVVAQASSVQTIDFAVTGFTVLWATSATLSSSPWEFGISGTPSLFLITLAGPYAIVVPFGSATTLVIP